MWWMQGQVIRYLPMDLCFRVKYLIKKINGKTQNQNTLSKFLF